MPDVTYIMYVTLHSALCHTHSFLSPFMLISIITVSVCYRNWYTVINLKIQCLFFCERWPCKKCLKTPPDYTSKSVKIKCSWNFYFTNNDVKRDCYWLVKIRWVKNFGLANQWKFLVLQYIIWIWIHLFANWLLNRVPKSLMRALKINWLLIWTPPPISIHGI